MSDDSRQIDSFSVRDRDTGEECWVGVRVVAGNFLLTLSRASDGDVEITLGPAECRRLAAALLMSAVSE
jgi:hypothetical protein